MLQSLAFTYRLVIERISNKQNTIIRDIIYSGHYVRNEIFLQMLADVTKCTVGVDVPQKDQFFNNLDSKFIVINLMLFVFYYFYDNYCIQYYY